LQSLISFAASCLPLLVTHSVASSLAATAKDLRQKGQGIRVGAQRSTYTVRIRPHVFHVAPTILRAVQIQYVIRIMYAIPKGFAIRVV
jgi:hypothetical protein